MQPTPHPVLAGLERLVGAWELTMTFEEQEVTGIRSTFEWLEGGAYLLERTVWSTPDQVSAEVLANSPMPVTRIIGYDDTAETFSVLFADGRAVARVYQMRLIGDRWEVWRDVPGFAQRYVGEFDAGGRTISGRWEISLDNQTWEHDFYLTYARVG